MAHPPDEPGAMCPALFLAQKNRSLTQADLSRKGAIDVGLESLIHAINAHSELFSLSSCSGRIVVYREDFTERGKVRKQGCHWIWVSHEAVLDVDELWDKIQTEAGTGVIVVKFEPFILHMQCRSLQLAKQCHTLALESGFKNSGMTVGKRNKIVVACRSTHGSETPLSDETGQILVTPAYFDFLCRRLNAKMSTNQSMYETLSRKIAEA